DVIVRRESGKKFAESLRKGYPIFVHGKMYSRQYVKDETNRVSYEIEPESIWHDLARGVSKFERRNRGFSGSVEVDENGIPAPTDDENYELVDGDVTTEDREYV